MNELNEVGMASMKGSLYWDWNAWSRISMTCWAAAMAFFLMESVFDGDSPLVLCASVVTALWILELTLVLRVDDRVLFFIVIFHMLGIQTSNWPYQGHKVTRLVARTANCLSTLWPDSDHWTHAPGVYCVTANSWWRLHSCIIEDPLWDDSQGLYSRVPARSWILLSDMTDHTFNTTHH